MYAVWMPLCYLIPVVALLNFLPTSIFLQEAARINITAKLSLLSSVVKFFHKELIKLISSTILKNRRADNILKLFTA